MSRTYDAILKELEEAAAEMADAERKEFAKKAASATIAGYNRAVKAANPIPGPPPEPYNGPICTYPGVKSGSPCCYCSGPKCCFCNKTRLEGIPRATKPTVTAPVFCKRCNEKNEFSGPNQPDGSFICYGCRS